MLQGQSEEPDPLLTFPTESTAAIPPDVPAELGMQPDITEDFPPPAWSPAYRAESEIERVDRIERTLDQSRKEVLTLSSEIATLVGSIDDINRRLSRRAGGRVHTRSVLSRTWRRSELGFAAAFVVVAAGIVSWWYWPYGGPTIPAPIEQVVAAMPLAPGPTAAPPAKPLAPKPTAALPAIALAGPSLVTPRVSERAAPVVKRVNYVGTLSIESAPGGDVLIDRETAGRTPLQVANLRAGSHLIWIEREGYRRWTRVVTVSADRVSRVSADLEPIAPR